MASTKERLKWEKWFNAVTARMDRQKAALDRLVLIQTETIAALHEIASDEAAEGYPGDAERAKQALERIADMAAASSADVKAIEPETPVSDPRSNP